MLMSNKERQIEGLYLVYSLRHLGEQEGSRYLLLSPIVLTYWLNVYKVCLHKLKKC